MITLMTEEEYSRNRFCGGKRKIVGVDISLSNEEDFKQIMNFLELSSYIDCREDNKGGLLISYIAADERE